MTENNRWILAIDPGNRESGYVLVPWDTLRPTMQGKDENGQVLDIIQGVILALATTEGTRVDVAIEMVESYGMSVGKDVFETCIWIGRFTQLAKHITVSGMDVNVGYVTRKQEKMNLCHSLKANDTTIRQALVDRFAPGEKNFGKGTKKEQGFFYGFKTDMWSAMAIAATYHDLNTTEGE